MKAILGVLLLGFAGAVVAAERPELTLDQLYIGDSTLEISGLTRHGDNWFVVGDDADNHFLYRVKFSKNNRFSLQPAIDLEKLPGFASYQKILAKVSGVDKKHRRLDLEGITVCNDTFYLINERARHLLRIAGNKLQFLEWPQSSIMELFEGGANAGLEGIAADCRTDGLLYFAKERDPRILLRWQIGKGQVQRLPVPKSNRIGQTVINPWNGKDLFQISADIGDLHFADDHLYILERNSFEVAKWDPVTSKIVARVSFWASAKDLYETGEPFGLAEALFVDKDAIWIGFDNNANPLTHQAQRKFGVAGNFGTIARFRRPKSF